MSDARAMKFFEGFAWPVPRAFAAAIASCRFEQGDLLYSDRVAYGARSKTSAKVSYSIQVLNPPRSTRALKAGAEGGRFEANWDSDLELSLTAHEAGRKEIHSTTQGRLFRCLWLGDPAQVSSEAPAPEVPGGQRELHRRLGEARASGAEHFRRGSDPFWLFLSAFDEASDSARLKARAIEAVLTESFESSADLLWPAQVGLCEAERMGPTLRILGIALRAAGDPSSTEKKIEEKLRGLLFAGDSESGRFSLARHGLLVHVP